MCWLIFCFVVQYISANWFCVSHKSSSAKRKFNRWYVYFKGVAPKDNVGCGCKTAKSAMRYMHLLKARYGATISQNIYERLQFEAAREEA